MTSFVWKRKAGQGLSRLAAGAFKRDAKDEDDNEVTRGEIDWLTLAPKRRAAFALEDPQIKSHRLRDEGATLAEAERYWEAIKKWDEGLLLTPGDSKMLDMKAQALMALGEVFAAVHTAQQAVSAEPTWWVARQTLGRAQLNMGEVGLAVRSFSKAILLNPTDEELWKEDLQWAYSVRNRMLFCKKSSVPTEIKSQVLSVKVITDDAETASESLQVALRTQGENSDTESEREQQIILQVPPNFVHLRG